MEETGAAQEQLKFAFTSFKTSGVTLGIKFAIKYKKFLLFHSNIGVSTHMTEGNFYAFEGLDGVGKTSTAKAFADEIDAAFMQTPGPGLEEIRDYVDSDIHSPQTEFLLYLGSVSAVSDHVEQHLEAGNDVVLDRYYPSTVVYRNANTNEDWTSYYKDFDFTEPDEIFFLWTDEKTRMGRIENRDVLDKEEEIDSDFMNEVRNEYLILAEEFDMVPIEAVEGINNVVDKVMDEIKEEYSQGGLYDRIIS